MAILDKKTGKVLTGIWFGNFYRPAYDDEAFVREAVSLLKSLNFNCVLQDAKDWEDLHERCLGGEASQYVNSMEQMQAALSDEGMSHAFLALYLNGDNLYPDIRFSRPLRTESVTAPDGKSDGHWYRYWSETTKQRQTEHVRELMNRYAKGYTELCVGSASDTDAVFRPICSMWDPIVAPSFDADGTSRYVSWLKKRYGSIRALNRAYGAHFLSFEEIPLADVWFDEKEKGCTALTAQEIRDAAPRARMAYDNRKWQSEELCLYFEDMSRRLHGLFPDAYLIPNLTQWGYYLNIDGGLLTGVGMADLWDTATRGIDLYALASYVDCTHFLSVPVTPEGDPDPYVVSCSHSMMRAMNRGRDFAGGIYWGRFLYQNVYHTLTPEEVVGSMTACGAGGYISYGMCGMDDGGMLQKMPEDFLDSLARANDWMQQTVPALGERIPSEALIVFPSQQALFETYRTPGNRERREDLSGWYRLCCDFGVSADVVSGAMLRDGVPEDVKLIILPANDACVLDPDRELEEALVGFVRRGGVLVHGPLSGLLPGTLGVSQRISAPAPVQDLLADEALIPGGPDFVSVSGTPLAVYLKAAEEPGAYPEREREETGIASAKTPLGAGFIYSFGYLYGYSYTQKTAPHVPRSMRNNAMYPVSMSAQAIFREILEMSRVHRNRYAAPDIETGEFENGTVVVSHSSYPHFLEGYGNLPPRTAVFVKK
jgi:hypothetical protein